MLCVTENDLIQLPNQRLEVTAPKMRAYLMRQTRQLVEVRFEYVGQTDHVDPLGSGEIREQFGFKLRAADACNLVYVMWRFKKTPLLVVQVKRNPGMHTSDECGNHGYTTIATRSLAAPTPGSSHKLRAKLDGSKLQVSVDGGDPWHVDVGTAALTFNGPVGIRSDNAHIRFKLLAPSGATPLSCSGHGSGD